MSSLLVLISNFCEFKGENRKLTNINANLMMSKYLRFDSKAKNQENAEKSALHGNRGQNLKT